MYTKPVLLTATIALSLFLSGCEKKTSLNEAATGSSEPSIAAPFFVEAAPEGAVSVVEARAQAAPGKQITLRGKVGGKGKPISEAAAVLVLADEHAITSCDSMPDDHCPTPWDYCCEESATIAAATATIQVRDSEGKLLRSTLRGAGGLKELSRLVIAGTVDATSTQDALIVNAERIYVEKP